MLWKLLKFFKLLVLAPALHMLPGSFFFLPSLDDGTHGALQANKEGKKKRKATGGEKLSGAPRPELLSLGRSFSEEAVERIMCERP